MDVHAKVQGQLDPRLRGKRTHICISCDFPIAVYGRCAPCLHAYCLTCAAGMSSCIICRTPITKLERIPGEAGLYISPATLQGFRSEADLAKHAQQLLGQIQQLGSMGRPRPPSQASPPHRHMPPPPQYPPPQQQHPPHHPMPPPPHRPPHPGMMHEGGPRPPHMMGGAPRGGPDAMGDPGHMGGGMGPMVRGPHGGPMGGGPKGGPGPMQPHHMRY